MKRICFFLALFLASCNLFAQQSFGDLTITQIGFVVKNAEVSAAKWAEILALEKFPEIIITDGFEHSNAHYRGKPTKAKARIAFIKMKNITIELIEPVGKNSTWYDCLKKNGESIHHIAFGVKGLDKNVAWLEKGNGKLLQKGNFTGGSYAYVDMSASLGTILELLTSSENN